MKNNKGFIGVGVIIAIIVALAVGGGIVYYATKTPTPSSNTEENNYQPQANQNSTIPPTTTNTQTPPVNNKSSTVTLDLSSSFASQYKAVLTEAFKKPANFNEHYVVAEVGCGTGCFTFVIIDKNTGKVYPAPIGNDIGQFTGDIGKPYSLNSNQIKIIADNGSKIKTYAFTGSSFSLLSSQNSQSSVTVLSPNTQTKVCSNAGMSFFVPNQSSYQCNTEVARAVGNGAVALNVGYNNKQVISIYKFTNQVMFEESKDNIDYNLVNSNYQISETTGLYYEGKSSIGSDNKRIVVAPKWAIITIAPVSYTGISQTTLDSIVNSISF